MYKTQAEILDLIKDFADNAHGEQVRKYTGERYITHPIRVMETVRKYNDDICVLAAALLHDVLEDTPVKAHTIESYLLSMLEPREVQETLRLVTELTDVFVKENFPRMNRRTRKQKEAQRLSTVSPEAQTIKYADIMDNVTDIVSQDADFAKVFVREAQGFLDVMKRGDPRLRTHALQLVGDCLASLPARRLHVV